MLIRISEAARILGVSASSLRNWEKQGVLPVAFRSPKGRDRYFDKELIMEFARKGEITRTEPSSDNHAVS